VCVLGLEITAGSGLGAQGWALLLALMCTQILQISLHAAMCMQHVINIIMYGLQMS
jgi:hypothetical protein